MNTEEEIERLMIQLEAKVGKTEFSRLLSILEGNNIISKEASDYILNPEQ